MQAAGPKFGGQMFTSRLFLLSRKEMVMCDSLEESTPHLFIVLVFCFPCNQEARRVP